MAVKNIAGVGGGVTMPSGFNGKINSWSGTMTQHTEEITGFDSGGFDEHVGVGLGMSGSAAFTGVYDDANSIPMPASFADGAALAVGDLLSAQGTLTLTAITGCTFAGAAIVTSISFSRNAKGVLSGTFSFNFTGFITQTWDSTP